MLMTTLSTSPLSLLKLSLPYRTLPASPTLANISASKKSTVRCFDDDSLRNGYLLHCEETLRRRFLLFFSASSSVLLFQTLPSFGKTKSKNPYDERRLLEQNKRVQKENNAPDDFPNFVREGFEVKVVTSENYVKRDSGLIYRDFEVGNGDCPKAGQQVTFHYVGYNESGRRIDSTYLQGAPAKIRMGTNALVPGFEEGIGDMRPGGKRRLIIPPELGPPVGPSTFFSSKQFEVFDVELLSVQDCQRRTIAFYSDVLNPKYYLLHG
ncbi:fk506-binding protein, putative [Ricinus communis]|uniref:peptidylprolyl isomerase n=1 Tax=Ricinus communis TaxID=3988 RepID=B9RD14_RICCO|nr:fk506-binding protein, putative [Ricinus communis]